MAIKPTGKKTPTKLYKYRQVGNDKIYQKLINGVYVDATISQYAMYKKEYEQQEAALKALNDNTVNLKNVTNSSSSLKGTAENVINESRLQKQRQAEKLALDKELKNATQIEFVPDDDSDKLRNANVEALSSNSNWVNDTYLSNNYLVPLNDTHNAPLNFIIALAIKDFGKGIIPLNAVITTMAIETGYTYVKSSNGTYRPYSETRGMPGFASIRPSGIEGLVTSASGYCQVVSKTGMGYMGDRMLNFAQKSLGITNTDNLNFLAGKSKSIGKKTKMESFCYIVGIYPGVGIALHVAYMVDVLKSISGCKNAKKYSDIKATDWLEAVRRYYGFPMSKDIGTTAEGGYKSCQQRDKYAGNYCTAALKIFGDKDTLLSNVVGKKILNNDSIVTPEQILAATSAYIKEKTASEIEDVNIGNSNLNTSALDKMYYGNGDTMITETVLTDDQLIKAIEGNAWSKYEQILKSTKNKRIDITGVIGMPPRFGRYTDCRMGFDVDDKNEVKSINRLNNIYGRVYTENFIKMGNLVSLTPGVPDFMFGFGTNDKETILTQTLRLQQNEESENKSADVEVAAGNAVRQVTNAKAKGKTLFGFKNAWADYAEHSRRLIVAAAAMMQITDDELVSILDENEIKALGMNTIKKPNDKTSSMNTYYDESKYAVAGTLTQFYNTNMAITDSASKTDNNGILNNNQDLQFYNTILYNSGPIESSESVSNSVKSSFLESALNLPMSEMMKDMSFLLNAPVRSSESLQLFKDKTSGLSSVMNFALGVIGLNGVGGALTKLVSNIKIPKVFGDSSYSKQYNIRLKLAAPSADRLSRFKYVIMPLMRLLPYCVPRQYGFYPDAIISPFLTQIYAKGLIACELGMVTAFQIERNVETAGLDGVPTEIDVTFTVTELNPFFSIPFDPLSSTANYDGYLMSGAIGFISTLTGTPLYRGDSASVIKAKTEWGKGLIGQMMHSPTAYSAQIQSGIGQFIYQTLSITNFSPFNSTR